MEKSSQIDNYYKMLESIEAQLESLDVHTLNELLQQTFDVKPVRLKWYLLKAQVMLKEGISIGEIRKFLADKCAPWYEYDDVEEYFQLLMVLSEIEGDILESKRYLYQMEKMRGEQNYVSQVTLESEMLSRKVLDSSQIEDKDIDRLLELYYIAGENYLYLLWFVLRNEMFGLKKQPRTWILEKPNVEYFYERLLDEKQEVFAILVAPGEEMLGCLLVEKALQKLGKTPMVIDSYDTVEEALCRVAKESSEDNLITVLGKGWLIDELAMSPTIKPKLERLTEAQYDYMEDCMAVGRYGEYLSYVARIYKTTYVEIKQWLYQKPTCRFSIIIPCRNAGEPLIYTLKTCLNQSFQGSYEVLVCDNSDQKWGNDTPTLRMCQELQDDRIRYIRTPRDLTLAKNFEYAYLHANGEFLISMGADDGILEWALEELDAIIEEQRDRPIVIWHEAFYKWADVDEHVMEDAGKAVLRVDHPYIKNNARKVLYSAEEAFLKSFNNYAMLYYMPQIYHNSGIRREYMQKIYERCGVLWAGGQQDLYMAVLCSNIEKELCMVENLFTITGISNNSIGANARVGNTDFQQQVISDKYISTRFQGHRVPGYFERIFPEFGTEVSSLFMAIQCVYALGIIPKERYEKIDWKEVFQKVISGLSIADILFDKKWHWMRYVISLYGEEMLMWFDDNYFWKRLEPWIIAVKKEDTKSIVGERMTKEGIEIAVPPHSIDDVYKVSLLIKEIYDI